MNMRHHQDNNESSSKEELARMREFAYRAPSPDSEPPTSREQDEAQETEGFSSAQPRDMEEAALRDPSPDDLDEEMNDREISQGSGKPPRQLEQ